MNPDESDDNHFRLRTWIVFMSIITVLVVLWIVSGCSASRSVVEVDVRHTEAGIMEERDGVRVTVEIGARSVTQTPHPLLGR